RMAHHSPKRNSVIIPAIARERTPPTAIVVMMWQHKTNAQNHSDNKTCQSQDDNHIIGNQHSASFIVSMFISSSEYEKNGWK
ncbi:MAG TPA: hypothetical protein VF458_20815, partial [Ktedonobacteraceae bacterium]